MVYKYKINTPNKKIIILNCYNSPFFSTQSCFYSVVTCEADILSSYPIYLMSEKHITHSYKATTPFTNGKILCGN